jgi:hypothetical protein
MGPYAHWPAWHLAAAQSDGTEKTAQALLCLLNYAATTNPNACIRYSKASDMILYIHSNAWYLSEAKAHSCVGGHFFLSIKPFDPTKPPAMLSPQQWRHLHTVCSILKNMMSSATEAEFAGLYRNARDDATLQTPSSRWAIINRRHQFRPAILAQPG